MENTLKNLIRIRIITVLVAIFAVSNSLFGSTVKKNLIGNWVIIGRCEWTCSNYGSDKAIEKDLLNDIMLDKTSLINFEVEKYIATWQYTKDKFIFTVYNESGKVRKCEKASFIVTQRNKIVWRWSNPKEETNVIIKLKGDILVAALHASTTIKEDNIKEEKYLIMRLKKIKKHSYKAARITRNKGQKFVLNYRMFAKFGKRPYQSKKNNAVPLIIKLMKKYANDPSSLTFIEWSELEDDLNNGYKVMVAYRGRNALGALVFKRETLFIQHNKIVKSE